MAKREPDTSALRSGSEAPLRLVLATPLYPPELGGPATDSYAVEGALRKEGHEPIVVPFSKVRHLPVGIRHLRYFFLVAASARKAHAVVSFDVSSVGLPTAIAAGLFRCPFIVRVPGDYAWEQGVQRFGVTDSIDTFQTKRYGLQVELLRAVQRFIVRSADLVVVPSDYFYRVVSGWRVEPKHLERIYLGLDFDTSSIRRPHVQSQRKVMFSSGRFVPWKGFSLILELLKDQPSWHAVIAGDGPLRSELESYATELGVEDRVTFTGPLPHAEVLGWCAEADAFVLNTSFESFSFQILEAMATGAAVITTSVGSLPELITNGKEGILCTPNDRDAFSRALESIEREPEVWQKRRAAAQEKAKGFSLSISAKAFTRRIIDLCV